MTAYWEPGTQYNLGDIVEYEGARYKIIQAHFSQGDWAPPVTPALWGRLSSEDAGGYKPSHLPDDYHQQSYGDHAYQQPAQVPTQVHEHEQKKHWFDLDDHRKKELEMGGGLLAGAAILGAGYFAFKSHQKNEEEKKALTWALQNWVKEAEARTDLYRRDGPSGPANWVLNHGTNIPQNAILIGEEHDWKLYTCRAFQDGGLQLGKASNVFQKGAVIGYANEEIQLGTYEILVGDMSGLRWVDASGRLDLGALGATPVEGGRENDGTKLYIARAPHHGAVHPGKASESLDGAFIPYDGKEKKVNEYQVLCYA